MTYQESHGDYAFSRQCRRIALACLIVALLLPVAVVATGGSNGMAEALVRLPEQGIAGPVPPATHVVMMLLVLVPVLLTSAALLEARRCFAAFSTGDWFSPVQPRALAGCGRYLLMAAVMGLILPTLLGLVLTANAPEGQHVLTVSISGQAVIGALIGAMLWSLGRVWARAQHIALENAQFV